MSFVLCSEALGCVHWRHSQRLKCSTLKGQSTLPCLTPTTFCYLCIIHFYSFISFFSCQPWRVCLSLSQLWSDEDKPRFCRQNSRWPCPDGPQPIGPYLDGLWQFRRLKVKPKWSKPTGVDFQFNEKEQLGGTNWSEFYEYENSIMTYT